MGPMWLDIKHAFRSLARNLRFTLSALLMLALGIGISTATFTIVNSVLIEPLHFGQPDRIVSITTRSPSRKNPAPRVTGGDFLDVRSAHIFEEISYYYGGEMGIQAGKDTAEFTGTYLVNSAFFRILGLQMERGRPFDDKEQAGAVVSHVFATRHFGSASNAIGKVLRLENKSYEILGVSTGARFPAGAEVWLTASYVPENVNRTAYNYYAIALLKRGSSLARTQQELGLFSRRLALAFPTENKSKELQAVALRDQLVGPVRTTLYLLLGAVLVTVAISCANFSNLLLARGTMRKSELAIRAALGASRGRVVGQLVLESLIIAALAGLTGTLLAVIATPLLIRFAPADFPRLTDVHVSPMVIAFSVLLSILAALLSGMAPALVCSRTELGSTVNQVGTRGTVGSHAHRLRDAFVVAEIALALVLTSSAGLLLRSFFSLNSAQLGYKPDGVLVTYAHAPAKTLNEHIAFGRILTHQILPEIAALPRVSSTAAVMGLPTGKYGSNGHYAVVGKHEFKPGAKLPDAGFRLASPDYFAAMRIPLLRGRDFTVRDEFDSPFVAIISESLARQVFPVEDPIGRQIVCGLDSPNPMTIVGIVGDVRQNSPASEPGQEIYMPLQQHPYFANEVEVVVRAAGRPTELTNTVRQTFHKINPEIATKFSTLDSMVGDSISVPRSRTFLVGTFAAFALILAMAGTYSVMNYVVGLRIPELGLRMAVGAGPGDVLRLVLLRASMLIAGGLIAGTALSVITGKILRGMLFGVEPNDPLTNASVIIGVALIATAAAFGPAVRASRIDPVTALGKA